MGNKITIFAISAIVLIIGGICLFYLSNWNKKDKKENPGYRCGSKGCKYTLGGEFDTEEDCIDKCQSYVKENGNCFQVDGIPWNSFATYKTCVE